MDLILTSKADPGSETILTQLLTLTEWDVIGEYDGLPVLRNDKYFIVSITKRHIFAEGEDDKIRNALGIEFDTIIVASRHKSVTGRRTLTVHPVGNYKDADFGGKPKTLGIPSPNKMTQALRILSVNAKELDYGVCYEVTHHGPFIRTPLFFIEIGSTENEWGDEEAGKAIAKTILDITDPDYDVAVGVGGGHYAPRFTEVAMDRRIAFGHMIPNYALDGIDKEMVKMAIKVSGAKLVYIHRKSMKKSVMREWWAFFEGLGLKVVRTKDLLQL